LHRGQTQKGGIRFLTSGDIGPCRGAAVKLEKMMFYQYVAGPGAASARCIYALTFAFSRLTRRVGGGADSSWRAAGGMS
jgi:hypothetical protein